MILFHVAGGSGLVRPFETSEGMGFGSHEMLWCACGYITSPELITRPLHETTLTADAKGSLPRKYANPCTIEQ